MDDPSSFGPCVHGGAASCKRQGGSGAAAHAKGYSHPFPTTSEVGAPVGDASHVDEGRITKSLELGPFLDNSQSQDTLELQVSEAVDSESLVRKSIYNFDVETNEGIQGLLAVIPILDPEILKEVYTEILPGYPTDENFDTKMARKEVRGYLLDYLASGAVTG